MQFKPMDERGITITFGDEVIKLKSAIIGGMMDDNEPVPMGMYTGSVDIGELGIAVLHSCRAVIKILNEMHGLDIDQSIDFIRFCTLEASDRESMERLVSGLKTGEGFKIRTENPFEK